MDNRLQQQLAFLVEIDRMKNVMRQTLLADSSRRESDAEHSFSLAMFAMLLAEHAEEEIDISRVIRMVLVHDLIEKLKERDLYQYVSRIDLNKKYRITVQIHDVITVNFGNSENFAQKVNALVHILAENDVAVPAEISVRNYSEGRYSRLPDPVTDSSSDHAPQVSSTNSDRNAGKTVDNGTPSDVEN